MQDILQFLTPILELIAPKTPPGSALFIILVALFVSVTSTVVSRKFIDIKKLNLYTKKTKEYQALQRKSLRSQDPTLKKKLDNQKGTFQRMQSELMKMRFKPLLITMLPLIVIFFALSAYYNPTANDPVAIVANIPFDLPENVIFNFGHNCNAIRADVLENNPNILNNATALKDLTGIQQMCVENPELHYVPSYIGWYIAINVILSSVLNKFAGLTPE